VTESVKAQTETRTLVSVGAKTGVQGLGRALLPK
jgi:hypothetical protein